MRGMKRKNDGGNNNKNKKAFWADPAKVQGIPLNTRGILVSCVMGRENQAGREAISIISGAYDTMTAHLQDQTGTEADAAVSDPKDISALIADEVADLKDIKKQLFSYSALNIPCLLYVQFNTDREGPSPSDVLMHICKQVQETKQNNTRLCTRFYPVEYTCAANMEAMEKLAKIVAEDKFTVKKGEEGTTFSVEFDKRASDPSLDRMDVINLFAKAVPTPPHTVNLSKPAKTIMINIIKGTCGVGIGLDFKGLARYNIKQIANPGSDDGSNRRRPKPAKKEEGAEKKEEEVSKDAEAEAK